MLGIRENCFGSKRLTSAPVINMSRSVYGWCATQKTQVKKITSLYQQKGGLMENFFSFQQNKAEFTCLHQDKLSYFTFFFLSFFLVY